MGLRVGLSVERGVGLVGAKVGAKVGPVGMNVTPAGNLSFGICQDLPCIRDSYNCHVLYVMRITTGEVWLPRIDHSIQPGVGERCSS
jgi:hypothetical protein